MKVALFALASARHHQSKTLSSPVSPLLQVNNLNAMECLWWLLPFLLLLLLLTTLERLVACTTRWMDGWTSKRTNERTKEEGTMTTDYNRSSPSALVVVVVVCAAAASKCIVNKLQTAKCLRVIPA